jgi:hypothetical protein
VSIHVSIQVPFTPSSPSFLKTLLSFSLSLSLSLALSLSRALALSLSPL